MVKNISKNTNISNDKRHFYAVAKYAAKNYLVPLEYTKNEMSMEEFIEFEEMMLVSDDYESAYMLDNKPKTTKG